MWSPSWRVAPLFHRPRLELGPAPRRIAASVKVRILVGGIARVLLWGALTVAVAFFAAIVPASEPVTWYELRGPRDTTWGEVTHVVDRSGVVRPDNEKGAQREFTVHYEYSFAGRAFRGVSYDEGTRPRVVQGMRVPVEVVLSNPARSRIQGLDAFDTDLLTTLIVAGGLVVLLGVALAAFVVGFRALRVIASGQLVFARLVEKVEQRDSVKSGGVRRPHPDPRNSLCRYTFEFEVPASDAHGGYRAGHARPTTHRFVIDARWNGALEDELEEPVLFDPQRPRSPVALDLYGLSPSSDGVITGPRVHLLYLLGPVFPVATAIAAIVLLSF